MPHIKESLKKLLTIRFALGAVLIAAGVVICGLVIAITYPVVTFSSTVHVSSTLLELHPIGVSLVALILILFLVGIEMRAPSGNSKIRLLLTVILAFIMPLTATAVFIYFGDEILPTIEQDTDEIKLIRFGEYGTFLKGADEVTLFSIESMPYQNEGEPETPALFHRYKVLGNVAITDKSSIGSIWSDLNSRIDSDTNPSYIVCFLPRHGLRAYQDGEFKDYLICFHCHHLYVYDSADGDYFRIGLEGENENKFLNSVLDEAGIKREQSPSE